MFKITKRKLISIFVAITVAPTTYLFELFIEQRDTKINQKIKSG